MLCFGTQTESVERVLCYNHVDHNTIYQVILALNLKWILNHMIKITFKNEAPMMKPSFSHSCQNDEVSVKLYSYFILAKDHHSKRANKQLA